MATVIVSENNDLEAAAEGELRQERSATEKQGEETIVAVPVIKD